MYMFRPVSEQPANQPASQAPKKQPRSNSSLDIPTQERWHWPCAACHSLQCAHPSIFPDSHLGSPPHTTPLPTTPPLQHPLRYFPTDPILKARVERFVRAWTQGSDIVKFTPKGLAYSGPWGSLRHVGNAMFLMKVWTVTSPNASPAIKQVIDCTVRKQLGYIIGDTGRSFVVGYGTGPPQRPHHRASSCPPLGQACTWEYYNTPNPNPNTLYGALVGGPGPNDDYSDDRNDYIKNEVATDYNAGFTGGSGLVECGFVTHALSECINPHYQISCYCGDSTRRAAQTAVPRSVGRASA